MGSRGANHAQMPDSPLDAFAYAMLLVGPIALLVRHRFPLTVFYAALACTAGYVIGGCGFGPIFLSLVIAVLTAATVGSRWPTYALIPIGYLCFVWPLPVAFGGGASSWWQPAGIAAWLAVLVFGCGRDQATSGDVGSPKTGGGVGKGDGSRGTAPTSQRRTACDRS